MKQLIDNIYNNAIKEVFTEETLKDENFDAYCYKQMIDKTHSIVIWGDSDGIDEYYYVISIREGATNTDDGLFGTNEIMCDATPDNTHKELYLGIKEKISKHFGIAIE